MNNTRQLDFRNYCIKDFLNAVVLFYKKYHFKNVKITSNFYFLTKIVFDLIFCFKIQIKGIFGFILKITFLFLVFL